MPSNRGIRWRKLSWKRWRQRSFSSLWTPIRPDKPLKAWHLRAFTQLLHASNTPKTGPPSIRPTILVLTSVSGCDPRRFALTGTTQVPADPMATKPRRADSAHYLREHISHVDGFRTTYGRQFAGR